MSRVCASGEAGERWCEGQLPLSRVCGHKAGWRGDEGTGGSQENRSAEVRPVMMWLCWRWLVCFSAPSTEKVAECILALIADTSKAGAVASVTNKHGMKYVRLFGESKL